MRNVQRVTFNRCIFVFLKQFQDLNEPRSHEYLDEITQRWSHYLLGTALWRGGALLRNQSKGDNCIMKLSIRLMVILALLILTAVPAAASPDPGSNPHAAQTLINGLNIGALESGQQFWYAFTGSDLGDPPARTVALNMVYKPGGHDVAAYVNFQVITSDQIDRWLQGYADQYLGMGTFTTTDFDQDTAERLWSGDVLEDETYYVHLFNNSGQTVEYHLTALGQSTPNANRPEDFARPISNVTPAVSLETDLGAEDTQWLLVAAAIQGMSTEDAAAWLKMADEAGWLSAGGLNSSIATRGSAAALDLYSARPAYGVERAADIEISGASRAAAESAPAASSASLLDLYPNVYPSAPMALHDGVNIGKLAPGGEHWYSFIRDDFDSEWFEFMPLTLFSTPTDGNTSHHINFQIFTGSQLQIWQRGTPEDMVPMGDGQWVSRDKDPVTGERLWAGHVIDGDMYYVRIFNNTPDLIDYYLITNDVNNTELGNRVWAANSTYRRTLWAPTGYIRTQR